MRGFSVGGKGSEFFDFGFFLSQGREGFGLYIFYVYQLRMDALHLLGGNEWHGVGMFSNKLLNIFPLPYFACCLLALWV